MLRSAELEGLVTALYTVGGPVRIDALFEAYEAARAAGSARRRPARGSSSALTRPGWPARRRGAVRAPWRRWPTWAWSTSAATRRPGCSPWPCPGWAPGACTAGCAPAAGRCRCSGSSPDRAAVLLAALADYDAEEGEAEIAAWLALRGPTDAAAELMEAASRAHRASRAAFAVLDRVGEEAIPPVREALADPVLRPHAAVWLRDHGSRPSWPAATRSGCWWTWAPACWRRPTRGRGGRTAARPALGRPGRPGGRALAGRPPGPARAAHRARRAPSRPRGGQGRPQGGVQGAIAARPRKRAAADRSGRP